MHSFPLKDPKPDYEELLAVLAGSKEPKKVHIENRLKGFCFNLIEWRRQIFRSFSHFE